MQKRLQKSPLLRLSAVAVAAALLCPSVSAFQGDRVAPGVPPTSVPAAAEHAVVPDGLAQEQENAQDQAYVAGYTSPVDEANYAVLALQANVEDTALPGEVVVLIDTSATQTGQFRADSLGILASTLANLPPDSQVQIIALDVDAEPMTEGFVAPDSPEMYEAMRVLANRVPLGATDLLLGLETAKEVLAERDTQACRNILYIGDGASNAQRVALDDFTQCVDELVAEKIPVSACIVGVRANLSLMGALANHTGGYLVDLAKIEETLYIQANDEAVALQEEMGITPDVPSHAGIQMASAVQANVVWPEQDSVELPQGWTVYPAKMPPLRSDRETLLVAKSEEPLQNTGLELRGKLADGNSVEMVWEIRPGKSLSSNSYLQPVFELAEADGGKTLPLTDRSMLSQLRKGYHGTIADRLGKALLALQVGSPDEAITLAEDVLRQEPKNKEALQLVKDAERMLKKYAEDARLREETSRPARASETPKADPLMSLATVNTTDTAVAGDLLGDDFDDTPIDFTPADSYVDQILASNRVYSQKVTSEVSDTLTRANKMCETDPDGAIQLLKLTQAAVRDNTSIDPDQRNQALNRLGVSLKQAYHAQFLLDFKRQQEDERIAVKQEKEAALHDLQTRTQKVVQILERYTALMNAGDYLIAAQAADIAVKENVNSAAPATAALLGMTTAYIKEYAELRQKRHRGTIEALMSAERSFIPFPDEPPLLYPDPEIWIPLSQRRKERFSPVNLAESGEAEKRITKALDRNIDLELDENSTFEDLFNMIKQKNPNANLNIVLGKGATEAGIGLHSNVVSEVNMFAGIKLRNILRQILAEHDLTITIRNEMLIIDSTEEANKYLVPKVYPVADLVIDPTPIDGGGGSGGLGSGSNFGGNNWGGGGGGGSNRGGGGGSWNIPTAIRNARAMDAVRSGRPASGTSTSQWSVDTFPRVQPRTAAKATGTTNTANVTNSSILAAKTTSSAHGTVPATRTSGSSSMTDIDRTAPTFINIRSMNRENPDKFWNDYFSGQPSLRTVRGTLAHLLDYSLKHGGDDAADRQIIAMVYAAIRQGHGQPWMYEPLIVALQRTGAPAKEIERVIMSAADFATDPLDIVNLAMRLYNMGLKDRALAMYLQVVEEMPLSRQVCSHTLKIADELYTVDPTPRRERALMSITEAIARQAWEGEEGRKLVEWSEDVSDLLETSLRNAGRANDADTYATRMREARRRDVMIEIEWTGDAGLDLAVTEPIQTTCWHFNPRTTSGGVLQEVHYPNLGTGGDRSQGGRIVYVCPNGFNGEYQMLVQKDWGTVTGNMFKATITTNAGSDKQRKDERYFQVVDNGTLVLIDIQDARRTESLETAMVETAMRRQGQVQERAAIGGFLKQMEDPRAGITAQTYGENTTGTAITGGSRSSAFPYYPVLQSVVGYRPVIDLIDVGAELYSNAVVSADRRYVRISPSPMFNSIGQVFTYNSADGETNDTTSSYSNTGGGSSSNRSGSNSGSNRNSGGNSNRGGNSNW